MHRSPHLSESGSDKIASKISSFVFFVMELVFSKNLFNGGYF
jgi:hypothetical protein